MALWSPIYVANHSFCDSERSYHKEPSISREVGTSPCSTKHPTNLICVLPKEKVGMRREVEGIGTVLCNPMCLPPQADGKAGYFS